MSNTGSDRNQIERSESKEESQSQKISNQISVSNRDKLDSLNWNQLTVEIRNLKFGYKKPKDKNDYLLNNINITFPRSAIYGMLGPSGCGKTTLLKIILGRIKCKIGTVKVNGKEPRHPSNHIPGIGVGFMPQELALFGEFSIRETLDYFAKIYGLNKDYKEERINFLITFLNLPDPKRSVGVLSGGQQRRVSFAVAIIHNPPFLILDEPTVGLDPVLREKIWEHLDNLSVRESTSIIITTHYIEEARRAHVIALMRSGKILVEHSPNYLLKHFKTQSLEEVFLKCCLFEEKQSNLIMPESFIADNSKRQLTAANNIGVNKSIEKLKPKYWTTFLALAMKSLLRIYKNRLMFVGQIFLPAIILALFCVCIGKPLKHLDVAVYNPELENSPTPESQLLSSQFLGFFDTKLIEFDKNYKSNESAIQSVRDGKTYGAIIFPNTFTEVMKRRDKNPFKATDEELEKTTVQFFGDLSDLMIFQTIYKCLMLAEVKFKISDAMQKSNGSANPEAVKPFLDIVDPPVYGTLEPSFRDFMFPGIAICGIFVISVALTALAFVTERQESILERTITAGVKISEIIFAQMVVQSLTIFIQAILLITISFTVFNITNNGNFGLLISLVMFQGICGMTFGLFISALSNDAPTAMMLALGSVFPYLIVSGIIWPAEGMPPILRKISLVLPQTLPVLALRSIMLKGWGITKSMVWLGYLASLLWTAIFAVMAIIFTSIRSD